MIYDIGIVAEAHRHRRRKEVPVHAIFKCRRFWVDKDEPKKNSVRFFGGIAKLYPVRAVLATPL